MTKLAAWFSVGTQIASEACASGERFKVMTVGIGVALTLVAGFAALCFLAFLVFMYLVVVRTGGTHGLRDVAVAIRAYRVPLPQWRTRDPRQ